MKIERRKFVKTVLAGGATIMFPLNNFGMLMLNSARADSGELENSFINPPDSSRAHTWWHWMNGNVTKEGITLDLEAMKEAGLGGFQAFHVTDGIPSGPVGYNSSRWHELMSHTIDKAMSLGLEMCFHNCAGWSSSGGPWITPETSMKIVVWNEIRIGGPLHFRDILKEPDSKHNYYRDIAVIAFRTPVGEINGGEGFRLSDWQNKTGYQQENRYRRRDRPEPDTRVISADDVIMEDDIVDLTGKMGDNGRLDWDVPEGQWTVVRFGYTTTGITNHPAPAEGEGLECDKLSKEGAEAHWNGIVKKVIQDAGSLLGKSFNSILIDSYETGSQNWTDNFGDEFRQRRGYDIKVYLPCLTGRVVGSIEISERFLWDFRRTVADMFAENYYGHFAELCRQSGLDLYIEPYGASGFFDDFANSRYADIPMGEFWVNRYDAWHWWSSKLSSSAAHVYGRKYVGSETFTAGGKDAAWISHPYSLKTLGDYFYCKGINRFIFHDYAHHPWPDFKPGMTMGPHGFQMNRGNTWWKQSEAWLTYLSRSQYMLQQGQFVADICYYFGENMPNTLVQEKELQPVPPEGYDYDAFSSDVLMQLEVKNGKLVLPGGMEYRVLVLPHFDRTMRPEVIRKIRDLVRDGAVVTGPKPTCSPSLSNHIESDKEVQAQADAIWGDIDGKNKIRHNYGKGRMYWGAGLEEIFSDLGLLPDFRYTDDKNSRIEYIHRRIDDADVYFISNQEHRYVSLKCFFRLKGLVPERWHPQRGSIEQIAVYREGDNYTEIPLFLEPAESVFIVFKNSSRKRHVINVRHNNRGIYEGINHGQPVLNILQARYGVLDNALQTLDVTGQLSAKVRDNQLQIIPVRDILDDPAPGRGKQLYIKYSVGGRTNTVTVNSAARLIIPDQPFVSVFPAAGLVCNNEGQFALQAWDSGDYQIEMSDGTRKAISVESIPAPEVIEGSWTVRFPDGWGAPEKTVFDKLMSWTNHSHTDIKHFSGTATYEKVIQIPSYHIRDNQLLWLDLGRVYNIAEVIVNGRNLGILWKPPFVVNISDVIQTGENRLEIRITNLWPNRLIGDEAKPDIRSFQESRRGEGPAEWNNWLELADLEQQSGRYSKQTGRYTWATWKHYDADDPLLESGLLGPVRMISQIIKNI